MGLNTSAARYGKLRRGTSCFGISYTQCLGIPDEKLVERENISFSFYVAEEARVKQTNFPRVRFKLPVKTLISYETFLGNTTALMGEEKTKDYNSVALGLFRSVKTF